MIKLPDPDVGRYLTQMRMASITEGVTLAVLIFVAVPLRHLFDIRMATMIMGPIHGLAFVFYIWTLALAVAAGGWPRPQVFWMLIAAVVPFGAFFNDRVIAQRRASLATNNLK